MKKFHGLKKCIVFTIRVTAVAFTLLYFLWVRFSSVSCVLVVFVQHCMVFKVHSYTFLCNSHKPRQFLTPVTYEKNETGVNKKLLFSVGADI